MKTEGTDPLNTYIIPANEKHGWDAEVCSGMNKREYFANSAMIGLLSSIDISTFESTELVPASVRIADELIEALNKPKL